jgi:hypothetical protein
MQMRGIPTAERADRRRGRENLDDLCVRTSDGWPVGVVHEGNKQAAHNQMRKPSLAKPDEGAVRKQAALCSMDDLGFRPGVDASLMQSSVHGLPTWLSGSVARGPACDEASIVIPSAFAARPMAGCKGDSFVEEEELGVPSGRHQRPPPPLELEPADDPERALPARSAEDTVRIMQAPAVAHEEAPRWVSDDFS